MNQSEQWLLKEKYQGIDSAAFRADCTRLAAGEPLAYVIGHIPFLNCQIYLDSYPLIPRPETEYWVEKAIAEMSKVRGLTPYLKVLDLGAGSGCIGVAVAKALPDTQVTWAEIDTSHLHTIEKNISKNLSTGRQVSSVLQSDLFEDVPGQFDFILTNPPYIDKNAHTVDAAVVAHEPALALFGGDAGMEVIARIVAGARAKLTPHGQLWIEHEPFQRAILATLAHTYQFSIIHYKDQYGTDRYSVLTPLMAE